MNCSWNEERSKRLMASFPVAGTKQTEFLLFSKLLLLVCHGWMLILNLSLPVCQGNVPPSLNCVIHRLSCMRHLIRFREHTALRITGLRSVLSNSFFNSDLVLSEWEFLKSLPELKCVPDITFFPSNTSDINCINKAMHFLAEDTDTLRMEGFGLIWRRSIFVF